MLNELLVEIMVREPILLSPGSLRSTSIEGCLVRECESSLYNGECKDIHNYYLTYHRCNISK